MFIETGPFETDSAPFPARVIIPEDEFPRLSLGQHEPATKLPPCLHWCYARLGAGGTRWAFRWNGTNAIRVYFAQVDDAMAFLGRWGGATARVAATA
jgi:hypothetical protein